MVILFVCVVSLYCIAGILVHLYYTIATIQPKSEKHYVLYTENEFDILEWYYRCFKRFSKTMGVNVSITVVGHDETPSSVQVNRWSKTEDMIRYVDSYHAVQANAIHIHLNDERDLQKLPF